MSARRLLAATAAALGIVAAPAAGAACPGAADPCPYSASSVVGQRAGGVLRFPQGIAVGTDGSVYVADQFGRDIQRFAADGTPLAVFGSQGTGDGEFTAGIGGLAVDPVSGDVFAVDSRPGRILRFTAQGAFVAAFGTAGTAPGQFRFGGGTDSDDTAGGGVVVGGGTLWVADTLNNRVQRMGLDGSDPAVISFPGTGGFSILEGVGWTDRDGGLLYVADNRNDRVVAARVPAASTTAELVGVTAAGALGPDGRPALDQPYDVALDAADGTAWVASDQNSRLVALGAPAAEVLGVQGVLGTFGPGPGQIEYPRSVAVGSAREVFLAEAGNNRVQVFGPDGASRRSFGFAAREGGNLTLPQGLAADPYGDVLVADTFAYRGLDLQPDGGLRAVVGAAKLFDTLREGEAQPDRFLGLVDLAPAPDGTVVALDSRAHRVVRFDAAGRFAGVVARGVGASRAGTAEGGIAVEPSGAIWVADAVGDVLQRLDPVTGAVTATLGGSGSAPGQLDGPQGLRLDAEGTLWVADAGNQRVQALRPDGTVVRVLGAGGAAAQQLEKPVALALDARGRVYVADVAQSQVLVYGTGDGGFRTRWGTRGVGEGELLHPRGIAVDCLGTVTVADTDANRLQRFVPVDPGPPACRPRPVPPPVPQPVPTVPAEPATPAVPAPPPPAPKPRPAAPPRTAHVSVRLVRGTGALGRRGVALRVSCDVACVLRPSFTLAPAAGGRAVAPTGGSARRLAARRTVVLAVRLRATDARALRRRLRPGRRLRLGVTLRATRAGARTSTTRRGFLVRP